MAENEIRPEQVDSTVSTLREGVLQIALDRAVGEVDGWQKKLAATDNPELVPISDNLAALSTELSRDPLDGMVIGGLLSTLGRQVQEVSGTGTGKPIADKLESLSRLLASEGGWVSGQ
ncbi:MAG: hypothetical protein H0V53_08950 [Rubrobacter sp.]|nr:hypothetical protein [Rubrobacter sp.]